MLSWGYAPSTHTNVWNDCPGVAPIAEICENLEKVQLLMFYKWNTKNIAVCKISDETSGEEAASKLVLLILREVNSSSLYLLPICWSKGLKNNLKIDEAILSIDFSQNYDNKQTRDLESLFWTWVFTQFIAECYFNRSVAIINGKIDKQANLI